jgi:hypothetical protein
MSPTAKKAACSGSIWTGYLGEKKFGGQLYSVAVSPAGDVYVGAYPRGVPVGTDAHILKFDPTSGKIFGKSRCQHISLASDRTGPSTQERA